MYSNSAPPLRVPADWWLRSDLALAASHPLLWPRAVTATLVSRPPHVLLTSPLTPVTPMSPLLPAARVPGAPGCTSYPVNTDTDRLSCVMTGLKRQGHLPPKVTSSAVMPRRSPADSNHRERPSARQAVTLKFGVSAILGTDRADGERQAYAHQGKANTFSKQISEVSFQTF